MRILDFFSMILLTALLGIKDTHCQNRGNAVVPSGFSCNFDSSYCAWTNDTGAEFNWTRNKGKTLSESTGPPWDHTTQNANRGSYLYIETSSPRQTGDRARIKSPLITSPGTYCLRFWHHMNGEGIRDLNVYIKENLTRRTRNLIHFSGAWSTGRLLGIGAGNGVDDWWNEKWSELTITTPVHIIFEGVRGKSFRGDIAIDDIILSPNICSNVSIDCDFQNDTCGWSQMSGDQFNWLPNKGSTVTTGTGPTTDHTLGTADGRYLYIEASWPRNEGDKARMISPPIRCVENANPVFRFWYHMRGVSMGSIRVYLVANETSGLGGPLWHRGGQQRHRWLRGEVVIPETYYQNQRKFHIIFEGERQDYHSDAAIDDLSLSGCSSQNITEVIDLSTSTPEIITTSFTPTTVTNYQTMPSIPNSTYFDQLSCDFDNQTICGWTFDVSADFQWTLNRGTTRSLLTGPRYDHTTTSGWYIYSEASTPRDRGEVSILRSPTIPSGTQVCLTFYYHMLGSTIGKLGVLTSRSASNRFNLQWYVSGQQSANETDWRLAQIDISEMHDYDIIIRATIGSDFYSDIAVDDITFSVSSCNTNVSSSGSQSANVTTAAPTVTPYIPNEFQSVSCSFDDFTICQWQQVQDDDFDFDVSVNGKTPSSNTGPDEDQTRGGQFAYIEASPPRTTNNVARIRSPSFTITSNACFSLWYHMHGPDIGSLAVYQLKRTSATGSAEWREAELWRKNGSTGNTWKHLQLNLVGQGETRLIIEAVSGDGWGGDIAIDNISLEEGECHIFNCSFQSGLCGWKQVTVHDTFDWTRTRAGTRTTNTGPQFDHTYRNSLGYFLYIETSKPRIPNDIAQLISPVVTPNGNTRKCLQFWYHSYGVGIGQLSVFKRNLDEQRAFLGSPPWYQTEDEGDQWLLAKIDFEDSYPYQVIFEGVTGDDYHGDIAIDDVTISDGFCPSCCGDNVFRCGNNYCIPASLRCNDVDDCGDGSDESFCQGCGRVTFPPRTSNDYGTVISLEDLNLASQPLTASRIAPNFGSTNPGSPNQNGGRVVQINPELLPRIKYPNFKVTSTNENADSENPLERGFRLRPKVEVITVRRKRDLPSFQVPNFQAASKLKYKLLQTYSASSTAANWHKYFKNIEDKKVPLEIYDKITESAKLEDISRTKTQEKRTSTSENHLTKTSHTSEKSSENKDHKRLLSETPKRMPLWQWRYMKKSMQRDKDDQQSESLVERVKREALLRIIGGNEVVEHSWPWQAAYYVGNATDHFFCGATLIAPYWAITAAHCVELGDEHEVVFGEHNIIDDDGTEQVGKVETIYSNAGYTFSADFVGDIALIKLKYPVRTTDAVQPACLLSPEEPRFPPGYVCAVSGWGRTRFERKNIDIDLRQGEVPLLPLDICQRTYTQVIHDSMLCAGGTGSNTCRGDSGGPLICSRNNTAYLVGVTSWGDEQCLSNVPGVYTRVQSYMTWMAPIMRRAENHRCMKTA